MIKNLRLLLAAILILVIKSSFAQVTLVSDNTNIKSGVVINGRPILFNDQGKLYTTNGTSANIFSTKVLYPDTSSSAYYKNELFFSGANLTGDAELWATDGTDAGTREVKDIYATGSSSPDNFFVFNT